MDRVLIILTLGLALLFFFIREGGRMTKVRLYEILIALYTFSCCFSRLYLPLINLGDETGGSFGPSLAIWPFYALSVLLIWIVVREKQWRIHRPNIWLLFIFLGYAGYTMLNPYNISRMHTVIEVFYLLSFAVFMYLFANCFTVKNVVNGVFMGLAATVILNFILSIW